MVVDEVDNDGKKGRKDVRGMLCSVLIPTTRNESVVAGCRLLGWSRAAEVGVNQTPEPRTRMRDSGSKPSAVGQCVKARERLQN